MGPPTSLAQLVGRWKIERTIRHVDGREDRLSGTATFRRAGPRLIQDEEGDLRIEGQVTLKATRRYVWAHEKSRFEVHFADMRPFHTIPVGAARPETTYLCPPDRYAVAYDFSSFPEWRSVWRVEGPKKDYRMETHFSSVD